MGVVSLPFVFVLILLAAALFNISSVVVRTDGVYLKAARQSELDLPTGGRRRIAYRNLEELTMETRTEKMERRILILYRQACRQGRADVAEHLLRALETLDQSSGNHEIGIRHSTLADAYRELTLHRRH